MKREFVAAVLLLCSSPILIAANDTPYPGDKLAQLVVDGLDVTSLPAAFRPKKEKGKKTFSDYGFAAQSSNDNETNVSSGSKHLSMKVLDRSPSGIYVCIAERASQGDTKSQTVVLLKRKDTGTLLKARSTFREFDNCPSVGGIDASESSY